MKRILSIFLVALLYHFGFSQSASSNYTGSNFSISTQATNNNSDTIDIINYTINLNITDFVTKVISGNTAVKFTPKMNGVSYLNLDLLKMTVDSIRFSGTTLIYNYNDTLLHITLPVAQNIGDTITLVVYYHGVPKTDAQWGGFYFNGGYAFNLGVGFAADPHCFGRVWFPCFDNFVERSTYKFNITTNGGKVAYCNGLLTKDTTDGSGNRTTTWALDQEIPSYLANVSVAAYTEVNQQYNGINGSIPIVLTALAADTSNIKSSFIHLDDAMAAYENSYGPYLWDKVGYYFVPFSSGAMEHATSISYPRAFATGSLTYENTMAHELSHHWFGDLVTCETEADMWINEGMASYSEHVFQEYLNGKTAYKNAVRSNHEYVLHYAHINEGGYRAVSGIPHQYTYGDHVYKKGADIAHTMRGYLGDSLFFVGLKSFLANNKYKHVNSTTFQNAMSSATGKNMTDFFNNWVFSPGYSHFSVDSFRVTPNGGNYDVDVYVRQKLTGTNTLHANVPLELTFYNAAWTNTVIPIVVNGSSYYTQITLSTIPVYVGINLDEKINDATAPSMKILKTNGINNFSNARMEITVITITDSAFIKVDHNYTAPDPYKTLKKYRLSPNRYWRVDGVLPSIFDATAKINYDGRLITTSGNGYLDNNLINMSEDSIVLLYRSDRADDWNIFPYYTLVTGANKTDKSGYINIDSLMLGEYVFAMRDINVSVNEMNVQEKTYSCSPNPVDEILNFNIVNSTYNDEYILEVYDISGRKLEHKENTMQDLSMDCKNLDNGIYIARIINTSTQTIGTLRFVVSH